MTMSKYIITLTPTGKFFFGGDMTFSVGGKDNKKYNEAFSSYIIKSNYLPQQTSLLGMLRFYLLKNDEECFDCSKMKIKNSEKAKNLIGEHSFNIDEKIGDEYGIIKSISPCYLQALREKGDWELLIPAAFDKGINVIWSNSVCAIFNNSEKKIPVLGGFDYKVGFKHGFVAQNDDFIGLSDIFIEDSRLGINKDYSGKTQDAALYKQINYRFNNEKYKYRFVFSVDLDKELDLAKYKSDIVSIGADSSMFALDIKEGELQTIAPRDEKELSIQLLSDARISDKVLDYSCFAISETVPFRNLESTVNAADYGRFSKDLKRSERRMTLYKRGSVFYFEDNEKKNSFVEALEKDKKFRTIGYNIFR